MSTHLPPIHLALTCPRCGAFLFLPGETVKAKDPTVQCSRCQETVSILNPEEIRTYLGIHYELAPPVSSGGYTQL